MKLLCTVEADSKGMMVSCIQDQEPDFYNEIAAQILAHCIEEGGDLQTITTKANDLLLKGPSIHERDQEPPVVMNRG